VGLVQWKSKKVNTNEAEECIRKGITVVKQFEMKPFEAHGYLYLGELFADAGEREKALENLRRSEEMFNQMGMDYWLMRARKVLASVECV
jgi:hypothetical protein